MRQQLTSLIHATAPVAALAAPLVARRRWSFVAAACLLAAVALWLAYGARPAFVAATLGVVAWFWDERTRLRPAAVEAERERLRAIEEEFDAEDEEADEFEEGEFEEDEHDDEGEHYEGGTSVARDDAGPKADR